MEQLQAIVCRPSCHFKTFLSDAASRKAELEWKEKARKELDEWYIRQNEQLEKMKKHNRYGNV